MSLLPMNNNSFQTNNPFQGNNILEKLIGGAIGAYYGNKKGGFMDGLISGYSGYKKPTSLYDRIMDSYLPNRTVLTIDDNRGE